MIKTKLLLFILLGCISIGFAQEDILLKNYDPVSVYNVPKTLIKKARFPIIDMHSHAWATIPEEVETWVATMDAKGVGEVTDNGNGLQNSLSAPALGMHFTDDRMKPFLKSCGELGMPINIHVAESYWMYLPPDIHNDGMMNAENWKIDTEKEGIWLHEELLKSLETIVKSNPETTIIACHFANCGYDLNILGKLLDTYENLYADIAARYAEVAPVPKRTRAF